MKREEYIKMVAKNLANNRKKIDRLHDKNTMLMTRSQAEKHNTELNWECMDISKNIERLRFALGDLKASDCLDFYEPSAFHKYKGVREELENLDLT